MTIRKPVPQPPLGQELQDVEWDRWFSQVSERSIDIRSVTPTISPASVAANTTSEQGFTVSGIAVGDVVIAVAKPSHQAGLGVVNTRVGTDGKVYLTYMNNTAGAIVPSSESYIITFIKQTR